MALHKALRVNLKEVKIVVLTTITLSNDHNYKAINWGFLNV